MKRRLAVSLLLLAFLAVFPRTAFAHPAYKDSDPKAGATVAGPPAELWIDFTESIEGGTIEIVDPCGERADHGEAEMNITSDRLTKGMHGDKAGTYTVFWRVLGSDSHPTRGQFTFSSSGGDSCPVAEEDEPDRPPERRERDDDITVVDDTDTSETARTERDATDRPSRASNSAEETRPRRDRSPEEDDGAGDQLLAQDETGETNQTSAKSIWDGIPIGDFLVALAIAALIGAAGGRIYAGILGPRR